MKILITCIVLFGILELINATCSVRGSIAFAIDGSDSISTPDFARMIEFTIKTIDAFDLGNDKIKVGALVYSSSVPSNGFFNLATSRTYIEKQIKKFDQPRDGTSTDLAIIKLGEILQNGDAKVGVVITDGESKDYKKTIAEAEKLRNAGVTMVAIGIGKKVNTDELKGIAGSDSLVKTISFDDLTSETTRAEIKELLCQVIPSPPPTRKTVVIDKLCIGCVISHGFGYNFMPGDCTKFVMCFPSVDSSGNEIVKAQIKQCGFGTYWSQEKHTCDNYKSTTCETDMCEGKSDGYTLPYLGCRSYWSCMSALPVPMCCPSGQIFSGSRGGSCVSDVSNACSNVVCSSNPTVAQCTRTENKNNRATYYEKVHGRNILRHCAPGTMFSKDTCKCGVHGNTHNAPTCNPKIKQGRNAEVGTQGKAIHKFIGAHGQYISTGARNVDFTTNQGYAIFGAGGAHSEINFWSLANAHFDKTFAVSFSMELTPYTGGTGTFRKEQVLDNCLCHTDVGDSVAKHPSISIQVEKRPRNLYVFTAYIETYIQRKTLTITQTSSGGFLDVTMAYNGSNIVFKVGGKEVATQLTGQVERRNTGLIFGRPTSDDIDSHKVNFLQAKMKNIVIYDCITKSLQDDLNNM